LITCAFSHFCFFFQLFKARKNVVVWVKKSEFLPFTLSRSLTLSLVYKQRKMAAVIELAELNVDAVAVGGSLVACGASRLTGRLWSGAIVIGGDCFCYFSPPQICAACVRTRRAHETAATAVKASDDNNNHYDNDDSYSARQPTGSSLHSSYA
jgi:hypothetical protein